MSGTAQDTWNPQNLCPLPSQVSFHTKKGHNTFHSNLYAWPSLEPKTQLQHNLTLPLSKAIFWLCIFFFSSFLSVESFQGLFNVRWLAEPVRHSASPQGHLHRWFLSLQMIAVVASTFFFPSGKHKQTNKKNLFLLCPVMAIPLIS
jgi:hypothetical protein